jgi:membrane protease YdiL (CAAX protease family)
VAIWIGWVILGEIAIRTFRLQDAVPWKTYPLFIIVLPIGAIGVLGPAAEEIVVRGILFYRIGRTRIGPVGAIVIGAALWAAAHVQYDRTTIALILLDSLVLGAARLKSRSTFVPIVMHSPGNLSSIHQSLRG